MTDSDDGFRKFTESLKTVDERRLDISDIELAFNTMRDAMVEVFNVAFAFEARINKMIEATEHTQKQFQELKNMGVELEKVLAFYKRAKGEGGEVWD